MLSGMALSAAVLDDIHFGGSSLARTLSSCQMRAMR
jgi:hypothetical protein